jgi:type I restriction enzyme S subunit
MKVENNRRICENLEAQAQALFKYWFIDFAPFKDGKFVESDLGMIPEGWRVGYLFDIAEVHDYKRKPLSGMQRANMKKIYPYYGATGQMDMVDNYIFDGRYVLMGEDGSVVRDNGLPYIQYVWGKIWVNNHAHVLTGKNGFTTEMLLPFLTKYNIKGLVTGAVQAKLNQANMAKISLAIPPKSILDSISGLFEVLYDKYRKCCKEMDTLSNVRDALLPKLMSGQIKL